MKAYVDELIYDVPGLVVDLSNQHWAIENYKYSWIIRFITTNKGLTYKRFIFSEFLPTLT